MQNQIDSLVENLDQEWIELMETAQEMGITVEEIRQFLNSKGDKPAK